MGYPLGRMTQAERAENAAIAVDLSARGYSYNRIAGYLGVQWNTAKKLVNDELAKRAEHRAVDKERHLAHYDAIQDAAWEAFRNTASTSLNRSGYLNTIKAAEDSKAKITGAEAPLKYQKIEEEYEVVWGDVNDAADGAATRDEAGQA